MTSNVTTQFFDHTISCWRVAMDAQPLGPSSSHPISRVDFITFNADQFSMASRLANFLLPVRTKLPIGGIEEFLNQNRCDYGSQRNHEANTDQRSAENSNGCCLSQAKRHPQLCTCFCILRIATTSKLVNT